jgi:phosphonatase-like hydrolase
MSIKLVVFDMAGTTVNDSNNVAEALQKAISWYGYTVTIAQINEVMGYPKPVAITRLLQNLIHDEPSVRLVDDIHNEFVIIMKEYYRLHPNVQEKAGASETFKRLRKNGVKVGIDTGFSRDIADVIFERMKWHDEGLIDVSVTSDEVAKGRPFPDMVFKAMEMVGLSDPNEVVKVGDTVSDLLEGNAAGCKYVIGITTGAYSREELASTENTHLVASLKEVADIVLADELAVA